MDYKKLIIDGYNGQRTMPYIAYFKQQAQIAKRDNFVEFADFFNGCKTVLNDYKTVIENAYLEHLHKNDFVLDSIYCGKGIEHEGEIVTDLNDNRIKDTIEYITNEKKAVEKRGYKNETSEYHCLLYENGDVLTDRSNWIEVKYSLTYPELTAIEKAIQQAEIELTTKLLKSNTNKVNTGEPQRTINIEKLKDYFNAKFKGMGDNNFNYFDWLVQHLQTDRTAKAFAQIALIIYESKTALNNSKPTTFKKWYSIFCECVSCKQKTYQPKDLRNPPDNIKNLFNYL
jgi:hypothetical protein